MIRNSEDQQLRSAQKQLTKDLREGRERSIETLSQCINTAAASVKADIHGTIRNSVRTEAEQSRNFLRTHLQATATELAEEISAEAEQEQ